ncbi:unnamed protein product, partial [Mesorhabditis spiculigera]
MMVTACTRESASMDIDDDKFVVRGMILMARDLDMWELHTDSIHNRIGIIRQGVKFREAAWSCNKLMKLLPTSRVSIGGTTVLAFDRRISQFGPGSPKRIARIMNETGPCEITPILRWPAAIVKLDLRLEENISNFDIFRKLQANYRHGAEELELSWTDDRVRCSRCIKRYSNAAPWDCSVCEKAWANCLTNKKGRLPEVAFDGIRDFSVDAIANMTDVAFCPMVLPLMGRLVRVSGKCEWPHFNLMAFTRQFQQRLERVHAGRMESIDDVRQLNFSKFLRSWLPDRLSIVNEGITMLFFDTRAYGKKFVTAFLWSKREIVARDGLCVLNVRQQGKTPANFLVALIEL